MRALCLSLVALSPCPAWISAPAPGDSTDTAARIPEGRYESRYEDGTLTLTEAGGGS